MNALHLFNGAAAVSLAALAPIAVGGVFSWLTAGNDDDEIVACHDLVIDMLADSDQVREVYAESGENIREQISVEDVEAIAEDAEQRRWGWRRN